MKRIVFAVAAVILVAGLAFGVYDTYQKRELRSRVVEIVVAAAGQLEETLGVDVKTPVAGLAERLDANVARADAGLQQLRALKARRDPELVAAADPFVSGTLEVLRRQAGATRHRARFIEDRKLLEEHMARVGARSASWMSEAIRLKKRLDDDSFDYQLTVTSLANMLGELVDTRRTLSPRLPGVALPTDAAIKQARERTFAAANEVKQELEQTRKLVPPG